MAEDRVRTEREDAIGCAVELYRDKVIGLETARVLLKGLGAPYWQIQSPSHQRLTVANLEAEVSQAAVRRAMRQRSGM